MAEFDWSLKSCSVADVLRLVHAAHLVAQLLAVVVEQGVGDRLQIAGDDRVELVAA